MKARVYVSFVLALTVAAIVVPTAVSVDYQIPAAKFVKSPQVGPGPVCPPSSGGCVRP